MQRLRFRAGSTWPKTDPENTRRWVNVVLMLARRLRRQANTKWCFPSKHETLSQCCLNASPPSSMSGQHKMVTPFCTETCRVTTADEPPKSLQTLTHARPGVPQLPQRTGAVPLTLGRRSRSRLSGSSWSYEIQRSVREADINIGPQIGIVVCPVGKGN